MARPVGATNRPQFHTYVSEIERKAFVLWVIKSYKKSNDLAKWYGDQMFNKAAQAITGPEGGPLVIEISEVLAKKNAVNQSPK